MDSAAWRIASSAQPLFPTEAAARFDIGLAALADGKWVEAQRWFGFVIQPDGFDVALMAAVTRARAAAATKLGDSATAQKSRARLAWLERDDETARR